MWSHFSIKLQLIIFMTLVVTAVEISTLFFINNLQQKESKDTALLEVDTISQSLNNDLLKAILNPNADTFSDISYRLSAFKKLIGLVLYDENKKPIFQYGDIKSLQTKKNIIVDKKSIFDESSLLITKDLEVDGYAFGQTLMNINLQTYKNREKEISQTILLIFPFALLFGLFVSLYLSQSFTKPFVQLISAMKNSDPIHGKIRTITTKAKNEIKDLFDGFNDQMDVILKSTQQLHFQAKHDQLTNIYNRFAIENELQNVLKNNNNLEYILLTIDLDQFKLINDSAGFQAGDELLKMIVGEYGSIIPPNSMFARVDGDGFMVLIKDYGLEDGKILLKESLEKLSDFRFSWNGETYSISACIGLVYFKSFQYTLKELLQISNSSLYGAKVQGRNKSYIYNASDNITKRLDTELSTASFIKEALGDGPSRFELFAQDIVPLQYETSKVSYEILIRMWDKDNNFVSPDDFLPTAQRYQLMTDIDIHVLWTYLQTVTKSKEHIDNLHSAHINLAGSSLNNPDFQKKVKEAVEYFDFPWEKLELEVTESSAIGSFTQANEFIKWIKSVGIGLALDDFGTGMASFEYLKSLPFDVVKIDGSFVKDMHTDPIDKAVIKYIQEIATLKGQETVAEYVETKEDIEVLKEIGITYGQGYYLGKPRALSSWL